MQDSSNTTAKIMDTGLYGGSAWVGIESYMGHLESHMISWLVIGGLAARLWLYMLEVRQKNKEFKRKK